MPVPARSKRRTQPSAPAPAFKMEAPAGSESLPSPVYPPEAPETARALARPRQWLLIALCLLGFGLLVHPLMDPDVYIHLRDGKYWLDSHFQVGNDPFSYTAADQPFEKAEWLFRIGIYLAWKAGGYNFLIILKALGVLACFWAVGTLMYRRWPHLPLIGALLGAGVLAHWTRLFPERPYIFTYLFLPVVMIWLEKYRQSPPEEEAKHRRRLWWIPPLVALWANLHPGFAVLFAVLGFEIAEESLRAWWYQDAGAQRRAQTLALVAAAGFGAGMFNSMGVHIYTFIFNTLTHAPYMASIVEWLKPDWATKPYFFVLLAFSWIVYYLDFPRTRLAETLGMLFFSAWALNSRRNIDLYLIVVLPILTGHLRNLWAQWTPRISAPINLRRVALHAATLATLVILGLLARNGYAFRLGLYPDYHPSSALEWMDKERLQGRLFHPFHWGGYIGWVTQGRRKIFMDGRVPLFGEKLYDDYQKMFLGGPETVPLLNQYGIDILLVSPEGSGAFYQQLSQSGQWAMVFWDNVAEIFVRRTPENQALIQKFEYQAVDPNATPFYNSAKRELALEEVDRARKISPASFLPWFFEGEIKLEAGDAMGAQKSFQRSLAIAPTHSHSLYSLGKIAFEQKQFKEAERLLKAGIGYNPEKKFLIKSYLLLASALKYDPARKGEALYWARQTLALSPSLPEALALLRELQP